MQNDHITLSGFGEQADDLMTEMAAAGFHGMSDAQADIVVRMGKLLDLAANALAGFEKTVTGQMIAKASNHALAMRMHGATLRGVAGAELLEDLCDAAIAKHLGQPVPLAVVAEVPEDMTVEDAMHLLLCDTFAALARELDTSLTSIKKWRAAGRMTTPWANKVRGLYREMQVRSAA